MAAVWGEITAGEIAGPISGTLVSGKQDTVLKGLSTDSRKTGPGELFWALKGERYDGHDFMEKALRRGAAGIVAGKSDLGASESRLPKSGFGDPVTITVDDTLHALGEMASWWRRRHNVRVAAITGSAGKTTTKEMTAGILELGGCTLKNQGNLNNLIGLPLTLLGLDNSHGNAVLEMGMNAPGEIARLTEIADPDVGVITNVGMAHLEGVGSLEGVARAKAELVEGISSNGKVVLYGDDELLMKTAGGYQKDIFTFGLGMENDLRASNIQDLGRQGVSFDMQYRSDSWRIRLRVPGFHNVLNALAAAGAGLCLDVPAEHVAEGLSRFSGVKGRFTVTSLPGGVTLVNDTYNANPSSLKMSLESVGTLLDEGGTIIVGLGEMLELGDETVNAHLEAGRMVGKHGACYFVAMGEHAREMVKGAMESGMPRGRTDVAASHDDMVRKIRHEMREGGIILLKGSRKMGLDKVVDDLTGPEY